MFVVSVSTNEITALWLTHVLSEWPSTVSRRTGNAHEVHQNQPGPKFTDNLTTISR